ncbi:YihY/virulence factor BrkB family protein [Ilyomonas limi]|uniref:YihY/virulence factor BrkB family protein n=1 Tax=Ilyomonas limi TaxID=2575867 RepID=A0A4U3L2R4_9BACT|nr:YihY/virulence factor BrkB family protein [Ilyomonas limi]TKK69315.1 YihY/virulence factor BrkB family protein [Ilyomonas limi]
MILRELTNVSKEAYAHLKSQNPLRLAGATAFFTTFALPPTLIIIIQTFGLFYSSDAMRKGVFAQLADVLGKESSVDLYQIFFRFQQLAANWLIAAAGFVFLLFVATTLFHVVRGSVNDIWCIKVAQHAGIGYYLKMRMKSIIIILLSGLILSVQLFASGLQALLSNYIDAIWSGYSSILYKIISQLVFVIIAVGWFTMLFKYLANAHPNWKTAFAGGFFTGVLFTIGKIILGLLLTFSSLKTIFGATGSFVLILLFVFYTSFIFYYGAAFTKKWSEKNGNKMRLEKHVYEYKVEEVKP